MKSSLKDQPRSEGVTNYCNKNFNLVNQQSPRQLEALLKKLNSSGPILGSRSFGRKKSKKTKSRKSNKKFGNIPFLEGKLSTSNQIEGLPFGAKSPNIYQTFPDIFKQGSPLPRPYGPRDNLRMQSEYDIHGFGRRRRKSKKCKSCKKRKSKRRSRKRKFGMTPGTLEWKNAASLRNQVSSYMNKYAREGQLSEAKGWSPKSIQLYMNNNSSNIPNVIGMPNEPAQYTNNQLNSPIFKFGRKQKQKKSKKKRPSLVPKSRKSVKRTRSFGPLIPNVAGPNTVGYQDSIPLYHAGANTIDFATNKLYRPDIISSIGKVQSDGMTRNAWLTQSIGIGDGLGNKYRFGSGVYTPNGITNGSGYNTIMQPKPSYSKTLLKFGKGKPKSVNKSVNKSVKKKRSFGGGVITLNPSGQISITKD
jgi:hypothetical protein